MLLSPRPTALLPSTGAGDYSPVTKANRTQHPPPQSFAHRATVGNAIQQPRPTSSDTSTTMINGTAKESPRRPSSRRATYPRTVTPELPRPESSNSMRSRESSSSINRSLSRDSISSMQRTKSRDSVSSRKAPRQFVVKSKAARGHHRPNSSGHLARTPSTGHKLSLLSMTQASPKWEAMNQVSKHQIIRPPPNAGNAVRRKALSMSTQGDVASPPIMRRIASDENGN